MIWSGGKVKASGTSFAIFPKRIGQKRIWLEWYKWTRLSYSQIADIYTEKTHPGRWYEQTTLIEWWTEYTLRNGYTSWKAEYSSGYCFDSVSTVWHEDQTIQ